MAKQDKTQGFAFKIGKTIYNFLHEDDLKLSRPESNEFSLKFELEKILVDAGELLESYYKDPLDVLDFLLEDLKALRKTQK